MAPARLANGEADAAASPPKARRPSGYWKSFNAWWRNVFETTGSRPTVIELKAWYNTNAHRVWKKEDVPPMEDLIQLSKGMRSKQQVAEYFRKYRRDKKAQQDGEDDVGLEGRVRKLTRRGGRGARSGRNGRNRAATHASSDEEEDESAAEEEAEEEAEHSLSFMDMMMGGAPSAFQAPEEEEHCATPRASDDGGDISFMQQPMLDPLGSGFAALQHNLLCSQAPSPAAAVAVATTTAAPTGTPPRSGQQQQQFEQRQHQFQLHQYQQQLVCGLASPMRGSADGYSAIPAAAAAAASAPAGACDMSVDFGGAGAAALHMRARFLTTAGSMPPQRTEEPLVERLTMPLPSHGSVPLPAMPEHQQHQHQPCNNVAAEPLPLPRSHHASHGGHSGFMPAVMHHRQTAPAAVLSEDGASAFAAPPLAQLQPHMPHPYYQNHHYAHGAPPAYRYPSSYPPHHPAYAPHHHYPYPPYGYSMYGMPPYGAPYGVPYARYSAGAYGAPPPHPHTGQPQAYPHPHPHLQHPHSQPPAHVQQPQHPQQLPRQPAAAAAPQLKQEPQLQAPEPQHLAPLVELPPVPEFDLMADHSHGLAIPRSSDGGVSWLTSFSDLDIDLPLEADHAHFRLSGGGATAAAPEQGMAAAGSPPQVHWQERHGECGAMVMEARASDGGQSDAIAELWVRWTEASKGKDGAGGAKNGGMAIAAQAAPGSVAPRCVSIHVFHE